MSKVAAHNATDMEQVFHLADCAVDKKPVPLGFEALIERLLVNRGPENQRTMDYERLTALRHETETCSPRDSFRFTGQTESCRKSVTAKNADFHTRWGVSVFQVNMYQTGSTYLKDIHVGMYHKRQISFK